mmetsp:Transcript_4351/g.6629  ORF Transcript_4351/g.6629 Transcript_4351/m.6629 type:complete len:123 (+) Transcript_4351:1029-1397(+)
MDVDMVTRGTLRTLPASSRKRHVLRRVVRSSLVVNPPSLQEGSSDSEKYAGAFVIVVVAGLLVVVVAMVALGLWPGGGGGGAFCILSVVECYCIVYCSVDRYGGLIYMYRQYDTSSMYSMNV